MFDEILREMKKISKPQQVSIPVALDDKGYYDRECSGSECKAQFKVLFEDWKDKIQDHQVFCPFCRHAAKATEWHTPEQVQYIKSFALAKMTKMVHGALRRGVQHSRPTHYDAGLFKLSMSLSFSPGRIPR